ncbi:MAG TPA: SMI1/KNR4 family protein [Pseudomonadales bacterium]|nr:SMI1/KNR4 family protein [Pseudomonadales bacterium]
MMDSELINGMRLPARLVVAMADGTWTAAGGRWKELFPPDEVVRPKLYSLNLMHQVNEKWRNESHPVFVGVADDHVTPGKLIPSRSLLIGELQGDSMIALDYRQEDEDPSVVFLNLEGRWVEVAASFDEFWLRLFGDE